MKDLKAFLVDYNKLKSSHAPTSLSIARILLGWNALQVLSFLCLDLKSRGDLIAKGVESAISLFNLPFFCKTIEIPLELPMLILFLLNIGYLLMTMISVYMTPKYKKMKDWSLNALCKLEHYSLRSEVVFLFSLAMGMEAIFHPQNFSSSANSTNLQTQKISMGLGIVLVAMSVLQYYWRIYANISVAYDTESIMELRCNTSMIVRGVLLPLISALAYLESPVGVFVVAGAYLLVELLIFMGLGSHSNIKLNHFTLLLTIAQLTLYAILLLPLWSNPATLLTGLYSQRSLGVLLLAPLVARLILNLEKGKMNYIINSAVRYLSDNVRGFSLFEMTQLDFVLRQMTSKFTNLKEHGPEIYDIITSILQSKRIEDTCYLTQIQSNLLRIDQKMDLTEYCIKNALESQFYEFINNSYSSILSCERKDTGTMNIGCYFSYIAFHKDITGNFGKAFIILSQLQRVLGSSVSIRAAAGIELIECDLQTRIAGSGTQKTISAELLFSFLNRSEKVQTSIEDYISNAFSFYEMLQQPIVSTKDIKNKGKKLLNDRAAIIKEFDSLIEINEYHQQTLLLYEFFLSEIIEEKAEGRFFQIKNRIDIFHVAEHYTLYRQQKMNGNPTDLELLGWDMSIEFFANQLDEVSDYSVIVVNINPENLGKIMKCSTNLSQLLGIEVQDLKQMNISNMEVTLFNPKNLPTLQEKILKGEMDLRCLAGEDRTLYLKHQNGCLIACSFVADVEIYGKDPCITCYLKRMKKIHEQEFILFSLDTEPKFIGLSKALRDGIKKKSALNVKGNLTIQSSFREATASLNIIELVPSLKTILHNIATTPLWSESQVLLTIPNMPHLSNSQIHFAINYIGKVQNLPLLTQQFGILEIQSYFPTLIHKYDLQSSATLSTSKLNSMTMLKPYKINNYSQYFPLGEQKDKTQARELNSAFDEEEATPFQSREIAITNKFPIFSTTVYDEKNLSQPIHEQRPQYDDNLITPQDQKEMLQPKQGFSSRLQSYKFNSGRSSLSGSSTKEKRRNKAREIMQVQKGGKFSARITDGRASSIGSSIGAHMGYLRSLILENKTPAVLKAVNCFGIIIFVTAVASVLVTYFILSAHYSTFSLFATSASFPAFVRSTASAFMITTEIVVSADFFPPEIKPSWQFIASQYPLNIFSVYMVQYNQFILNFNLPFLNEDLTSKSIAANFYDFSLLNRNMSFYEASDVFHAYAYKLTQYNYLSPTMDPALLDFTRTFMPSFYNMYGEVSNENFQRIYSLYDSSMITLDVIMAIGIIVSVLLMAIFIPVYWRYEKMETFAFSKLCSVTMKEQEPHLKKILLTYEQVFGKTLPALKILQENSSNLEKNTKKHKNSSTPLKNAEIKPRRLLTKKAVSEKSSNIVLALLVLFVSLLLSGTYIVINIIFKNANVKIFPLITDMEKISNGFPSYFTIQMVMMRWFNELFNPHIDQTLPTILEKYEGMLNESLSAQKEMNEYLLNSLQRMESSDVLSEDTKSFARNMTNSSFCEFFIQYGDMYFSMCQTALKHVANTGYLATGNHMIRILTQQIQNFRANPTFFSAAAFYYTADAFEFLILNILVEYYSIYFLLSVQADVANYSQKLLSQTHAMLGLSLAYNIGLLILLWIPTITYLRKRFKLSRNIFLLLPTKVLHHNTGIRNLFKTW